MNLFFFNQSWSTLMQDMVLFLDQGYIQLYKLDFYNALSLNIKATVPRQQFLFPSNHAAGAYL